MISPKPRILFCESSTSQTDALKFFFDKKGIEVFFSACSGDAVLEDIKTVCPHMVVLELFMPDVDAIAIKAACDNRPFSPKLFVAHGCYESAPVIRSVLAAGYDRYLLRPYSFEVLLDMIEKLFSATFSEKAYWPFLEVRADDILQSLGMQSHLIGRTYLRQAIAMSVENPMVLTKITKYLYPDLAKLNNTTVSRLERSIRSAVDNVWQRGNLAVVNSYFSCGINNVWGKPTNSEFIAILSDSIRAELRKEKQIR